MLLLMLRLLLPPLAAHCQTDTLHCCAPVDCASCICVNLHEQLRHLLPLQVGPQVGPQLGAELVYVQLPAAILISCLQHI
jgi:hypothetical protein